MKTLALVKRHLSKVLSAFVVFACFGLEGCRDDFDFEKVRNDFNVENFFDFSTVQTPKVSLSIKDQGFGSITSPILFKLYTENPVEYTDHGTVSMKPGVEPFYYDYTDGAGLWSGDVEFPAYAKKVYAVYVTGSGWQVLESEIDGGVVVLDDQIRNTKTRASEVVDPGTRFISVTAPAKTSGNAYDTQFQIVANQYLVYHNVFYFEIKIRASEETTISLSLENENNNDSYLGNRGGINVGTDWTTYKIEGKNFKNAFSVGNDFSYGKILKFNLQQFTNKEIQFDFKDIVFFKYEQGGSQTILISNGDLKSDDTQSFKVLTPGNYPSQATITSEGSRSRYTKLYSSAVRASYDSNYKNNWRTKKTNTITLKGVTYNAWQEWLGEYSDKGTSLSRDEVIAYYNAMVNNGSSDYASNYDKFNGGLSYANKIQKKENDGFVDDATLKGELTFTGEQISSIINEHNNLMTLGAKWIEDYYGTTQSVCPKDIRPEKDMSISGDGQVAITMLACYTAWPNSLAYYYYEGQAPKSLTEITPIMIAPCTLMWPNNVVTGNLGSSYNTWEYVSMPVGTSVQLYYFGPSNSMSYEQKSETFPSGTKIGFLLMSHAWRGDGSNDGGCPPAWYDTSAPGGEHVIIRSTTPGIGANTVSYSTDQHNNSLGGTFSNWFDYTGNGGTGCAEYTTQEKKYVVLSFEDHYNDENYNDVVFAVKTNSTFSDVPVKDEIEPDKTRIGVFSFEDLWPSKGDYDMNDVMLDVTEQVTFRTHRGEGNDLTPYLRKQIVTFKPFENYAAKTNGFALRLSSNGVSGGSLPALSNISVRGRKPGSDSWETISLDNITTDNDEIFITPAVNQYAYSTHNKVWDEGEIEVTFDFGETSTVPTNYRIKYEPFIYAKEKDGTWEVHLTNRKPSRKNVDYRVSYNSVPSLDYKYFGKKDPDGDGDCSVLKDQDGYFYVRNSNYPFAIYWMGAKLSASDAYDGIGLSKVLIDSWETHPIDEILDGYSGWVGSHGQDHTDWYLDGPYKVQ